MESGPGTGYCIGVRSSQLHHRKILKQRKDNKLTVQEGTALALTIYRDREVHKGVGEKTFAIRFAAVGNKVVMASLSSFISLSIVSHSEECTQFVIHKPAGQTWIEIRPIQQGLTDSIHV